MTQPVAIQVKDVAPFSKVTLYLSSAQRQVLRDALWDALENSADLTYAAPGDEVRLFVKAQHISSHATQGAAGHHHRLALAMLESMGYEVSLTPRRKPVTATTIGEVE